MPSGAPQPDRDAMEHAQLVMNALVRIETLMQPVFQSRAPEEQRRLTTAIVAWLTEASNATLRAVLLDEPCPAEFFQRWATTEQIIAWNVETIEPAGAARPAGHGSIRPSIFFAAFTAQRP